MSRRRRDSRRVSAGHGTPLERAEFRSTQRFANVLLRLQLVNTGTMFVGLAVTFLFIGGEFKLNWLAVGGLGVFGLGVAGFLLAKPLARWWATHA
jgi:hypothetical protein